MPINLALSFNEIGLTKLEFIIISIIVVVFPVLFIISSMNLDAKGLFSWMMTKPDDWIGRK